MEPMQHMSQKSSNMMSFSSSILSEIYLMGLGLLGSEEPLLGQPSHTDSKKSKANNVGFNGVQDVWKDLGLVK